MFRLLIVDDEPTIRKGLSHFIQWDSLDCQVIGTASDGQEAMALIQTSPPDIVITDIRMPVIDGIELSRYLYENYPQIKIILLTGYADFTYAQSAIRYQVTDFIVKPTSRDKLIEAVRHAQALIARDNKSAITESDKALIQEQLLFELTCAPYKNPHAREQLASLSICLDNYKLVALQITDTEKTFLSDQLDFIRSLIGQHGENHYCYRYHQNLLLIIYHTDGETEAVSIMDNCREIINIISDFFGLLLNAGISLNHHGYLSLGTACTEAVSALNQNFYQGSDISIYVPDNDEPQNIKPEYLMTLYEIEKRLINWEYEELFILIGKLFQEFKQNYVNSSDIKNICYQIYYISARVLLKRKLPPPVSDNPDSTYSNQLTAAVSIQQLEEIIQLLLEQVRQILTHEGKTLSPMIEQTILYINQNLSSSLTLESIASSVHVNPSYLSRMFKKGYGITLTEYINKTRVEKAQELLLLPNLLTYEIAEQVGFHDPNYFSLIFKKYTGLSPKEFRHRLMQDKETSSRISSP